MALENAAQALGEELGGYYIDEREVPPGELEDARRAVPLDIRDRIDAQREEAVLYVQREGVRRRRRWRRRVGALGVATVALGCGVWLSGDPAEEPRQDPRVVTTAGERPSPSLDPSFVTKPALGGTSVSVAVSHGSGKFVSSAYVGAAGFICSTLDHVKGGIAERISARGCTGPRRLSRNIARFHAIFVSARSHKEGIVLEGYAAREVRWMGGNGVAGNLKVGLSRPWTPAAPGLDEPLPPMKPVRAFVMLARPDFQPDLVFPELGPWGRSKKRVDQSRPFEGYGLKARLSDGRIVRVRSIASEP